MIEKGIPKTWVSALDGKTLWYSLLVVLATLVFLGLEDAELQEAAAISERLYDTSGVTTQRSFVRGISESLSVTSTFGGPVAPAQSFARTISDNVSITTGFAPPNSSVARVTADNAQYRTSQSYHNAGHRLEERLNLKNYANTKADAINSNMDTNGVQTRNFGVLLDSSPSESSGYEVEGSNNASDPDDNNGSCILNVCIGLGNLDLSLFRHGLLKDYELVGGGIVALSSGAVPILISITLTPKSRATGLLAVIAFRFVRTSGRIESRQIQAILMLTVLFLTIPSQLSLPSAHAVVNFVGVGTVGSSSSGNSGTNGQTLPIGIQTGDIMVAFWYGASTSTGSVATPSGWNKIHDSIGTGGHTAIFWRIYQSGDIAPSFSPSNYQGTLRQVQIAAWRGVDTINPIDVAPAATASFNTSLNTVGPITGITVAPNSAVIVVAGKLTSWTLVGNLSGDGLTWATVGRPLALTSTMAWDYAINGGSINTIADKTFTGTSLSAAGRGVMFSLSGHAVQSFDRSPADSTTITDSIVGAGLFSRSISDSTSIIDSLTLQHSISKSIADDLTTLDFPTREFVATQSISDTFSISDSINANTAFVRLVSETLAITDDTDRNLTSHRSAADTVALEDSIARTYIVSTITADTLGIDDDIATIKSYGRAVSDSITTIDSVITTYFTFRSVSDIMIISDSITAGKHFDRAASDIITTTDVLSTDISRSLLDSANISDSITSELGASRPTSDSVAMSDSISTSVTRSVEDSVVVNDSITAGKYFDRSVSDSLDTQDSISTIISRTIVDPVTVTDTLTRNLTSSRSISDAATIADVLTPTLAASRSISDSIIIVHSASAGKYFDRPTPDSIAISDIISPTLMAFRTITDAIATTDSIRTHTSRLVADSLTVSDSITAGKHFSTAIVDSIETTDAISIGVSRIVSDSVDTSDNVSPDILAWRTLFDPLTVSDFISTEVSRSIGDFINIADSVEAGKHFDRSIADSIALTDNIQVDYLASKLADDMVTMTDSISTRVSRSIADSVNISEGAIAGKHFERTISDSLSVEDFIPISTTRNITDAITTSDTIGKSLTTIRPAFEFLVIEDAIVHSVGRSTSDTLLVADDISAEKLFGKSVPDSISIIDNTTIALEAWRSLQDSVSLSDGIATAYYAARSISDTIEIQDEATGGKIFVREIGDALAIEETLSSSPTFSRAVLDGISISDNSARTAVLSMSVSDDITLTTAVAAGNTFEREASDSLNLSDSIAVLYGPTMPLSESVEITDEIGVGLGPNKSLVESITISDSISTSLSTTRAISESILITEAIGDLFQTSVLDNLDIQDLVEVEVHGRTVELADAVSIAVHLHVSINYHLDFGESLTLGECTPFACNQSMNLYEGISLNDEYLPPPKLEENITVSDSVIGAKSFGRATVDTLPLQDKVDFTVKFPTPTQTGSQVPDLRVQITTNKSLVQPMSATSVSGSYTMTNMGNLLNQLGVPTTALNTTVPSPNLPTVAVVLPTYHVNMNATPQLPGKDAMLTVKVAQIPAETPVIVPVNMAATASMNKTPEIPWMRVDFTPNVQSNDFALLITVLDEPPTGAKDPPANLKPMFIDVKWVGTDSNDNALNMSDLNYYKPDGKPTFTFAITDDWANANNAERDSNGVPLISLNLLDDVTGEWIQINSIDGPLGVDENGQYIFVAHLDHFSTYVVTANALAGTPSGSGSGRTAPASFAISLLDSLRLSEQQRVVPIEIIDEFAGRTFSVVIADRLTVSTRPVAYQTFQVSDHVDVSIALMGVVQEGIFPQTTKATFSVRVSNTGGADESFKLTFWYYDQSGRRAYESGQEIEIGPLQTKEYLIDIPFNSAGTFSIVAEARSVPDNKLLNTTQFTVSVPWLSIYLYSLLSIAIAIIGTSAAAVAILLIRRSRDEK